MDVVRCACVQIERVAGASYRRALTSEAKDGRAGAGSSFTRHGLQTLGVIGAIGGLHHCSRRDQAKAGQREYVAVGRDGNSRAYARRLVSCDGEHYGVYWLGGGVGPVSGADRLCSTAR
jgi:hypothetical protein